MKRLFASLIVLFAVALPSLSHAQQRLSPDDQSRFDSYFSRWQEDRRTNNHDETVSMEKRMLDIYSHYGIPADTPFERVASNGEYGRRDHEGDRDHDRHDNHDADRDHEHDRDHDRARWRAQLTPRDQSRFDSYYSRWLSYRDTNNQSQMSSMESRMRNIMASYRIPPDVPFDEIASHGGGHR
jgi:hypothetical protein